MTSSSSDESNPSAITSNGGSRSSPSSPIENTNTANISKAKSCKGCLYYSSHLKQNSKSPICVGITRSLPNVPRYRVGELETEAHKAGRRLHDFRYGCLGYSVYVDVDVNEQGRVEGDKLPLCAGFEVLGDRLVNDADSESAPSTHIHDRKDGNGLPRSRSPKPTGEEFFSRFTRNANVVAKGVAKNTRRVGNQIKHSLENLLYPYTRRPK